MIDMAEILDLNGKIRALHQLYIDLTGHAVSLGFDRERAWFDFLGRGFTEDDLRLVVYKIKSGIQRSERRPAALKFHNLIVQLDYFEEDLAEAKAHARTKRVNPGLAAALRSSGRSADPQQPPAKPVSEVALKVLRDFKDQNK
jgi:hypothetical protein